MYIAREASQRGLVLVFVLMVLLLLGLLVSATLRGSIMQLRMTRNLETAVVERQQALGEIERLLQHTGLDAPAGPAGHVHCVVNFDGEDCDEKSLPTDEQSGAAVQSHIRIVEAGRPPPRVAEDRASSGIAYRAVHYEVGAVVGDTSLVQGVLILVPESRL